LFKDVQWLFEQAQASGFANVAHRFAQSIDKGHGRIEIRRCWTHSELDYLIQVPVWTKLQTVVMVQSKRRCNGQVTTENRFFISSLPSQATVLLNAIRTHWAIENSLHWVLDVSFHEDACRIRRDCAPQNFALLRHLALNLLSQDSSSKRGIAARRKQAAWDQT
jgi:predicted transposase YbfD/YdcC